MDWFHFNGIDYNEEFKSPSQLVDFYNVDPYRASDHDPVIVGFNFISEIIGTEGYSFVGHLVDDPRFEDWYREKRGLPS